MRGLEVRNKIVVYTCVAKNYDKIVAPSVIEEGIDYVCFTDRPLKHIPHPWRAEQFRAPPRVTNGHDINRYHKIFPHHVLAGYDYSIYLDGNISYCGSIQEIITRLQASGLALLAFSHDTGWDRKVEKEVVVCRERGKFDAFDELQSSRQLEVYRAKGFDTGSYITENNFLVRFHNHPQFDTTMSLWWSQLFEFTKRDQLSLQYVCWQTKLPWGFLDLDLGIDPTLKKRRKHSTPLKEKIKVELIRPFKQLRNWVIRCRK